MIIAVFKGCYPYFSLLAICVIIWRIKLKLWSRQETIVLTCFTTHLLLEILQVIIGDGKWEISRRYLLPAAPLLFSWTAYGIWILYQKYCLHLPRWNVWGGIILMAILSLYDGLLPSLKNYYSKRKCGEAGVIATAAPWIKLHHSGKKQDFPQRHLLLYRSPYRPVVKSNFPALGFFAGGRSEPSPFRESPDFWVLPTTLPPPQGYKSCYKFTVGVFSYTIYQNKHSIDPVIQ